MTGHLLAWHDGGGAHGSRLSQPPIYFKLDIPMTNMVSSRHDQTSLLCIAQQSTLTAEAIAWIQPELVYES
jgi:hypothetical protein